MIVAASISGENKKYPGSVGMNSVEFFGLPVISFGITKTPDGFEEIALKDIRQDIYQKDCLKKQHHQGSGIRQENREYRYTA